MNSKFFIKTPSLVLNRFFKICDLHFSYFLNNLHSPNTQNHIDTNENKTKTNHIELTTESLPITSTSINIQHGSASPASRIPRIISNYRFVLLHAGAKPMAQARAWWQLFPGNLHYSCIASPIMRHRLNNLCNFVKVIREWCVVSASIETARHIVYKDYRKLPSYSNEYTILSLDHVNGSVMMRTEEAGDSVSNNLPGCLSIELVFFLDVFSQPIKSFDSSGDKKLDVPSSVSGFLCWVLSIWVTYMKNTCYILHDGGNIFIIHAL